MTPPTESRPEHPTETATQSTLDAINVETVRENGIIETPTGYAMLVEIEPRDWLTLSEKQRSDLYTKFRTYLRGVDFPTQFLTLTTRFDADQYYDQIVGAEAPTADTDPLTEPIAARATDPPPAAPDMAADPTTAAANPFDATPDDHADAHADAEPDTDTDAETDSDPDTDPETDSDPDTDAETDTHAEGSSSGGDRESPAGVSPDRMSQGADGDPAATERAVEATGGDIPAPDGGEARGASNLIVESPLLEFGRHAHVGWLRSVVSGGDVRDRRFFVAVCVTKGDETDGRLRPHLDAIRDVLPGTGPTSTATNDDAYLDEVWSRAQQIATKLPRTDVGTTVIDSRNAVMAILYHYYQGQKPPISFDHAALTRPDPTGLVDPDTGEALDLDETGADVDRQATAGESDPEDYPDRPHDETSSAPYDGRVDADFVDRVDDSRVLSWYVQHIGLIGTNARALTPRAVYGGALMFVVSLLFAGMGLVGFLASARPGLLAPDSASFWLVREAAYGLAAGSLPLFLLSLVGLLPTDRRAWAAGLLGTGFTGGAVALFIAAYPTQWTTELAVTTRVVKVYAVGLGILVIAVALAIRERRTALGTASTRPSGAANGAPTDADITTDSIPSQETHSE